MRQYDTFFESDALSYEPVYQSPYIQPVQDQFVELSEGPYYGLPYVQPVADTMVELTTRDGEGQYYGLPYVPSDYAGVSRVGPAASARPVGPASLNVPAGSLLSGGSFFGNMAQAFKRRALGGQSRSIPLQRAFSVSYQEKLRRRRRGGNYL